MDTPQNTELQAAFDVGVAHHQAGRLDEAEELYRRILEAGPENGDALHLLGVIHHQRADNSGAVDLIQRAVALIPDNANAHYNLGNAWCELGRGEDAAASYRRAIDLEPRFVAALVNLGNLSLAAGAVDDAVSCFERALAITPNDAEGRYNLGVILVEVGRTEEAIACYRNALTINPEFVEAHNNLGSALKEQDKLDEAMACYWRCIEFAPDFAMAHNNLGIVLADQGETEQAIACYRKALELVPDYAVAHSNLGGVLWAQGDLDEAVVACNRAIELDSALAMAHFNLGRTLQAKGALEAAAASYKRTIECNPGHLGAHFGLSAILNTTGWQAEARRALEQGVRRQPIGIQCRAKGERRATILRLVGLRNALLYIKEGQTIFSGKLFNSTFLIDSKKFTVRLYYILEDNLSSTAKSDLPPHDIVLNGITEPDLEMAALNTAQAFIAHQDAPFINDPAKVRLTSRDNICQLLTGVDNLVVPKVVRETLAANDPSLFLPVVEKHGLRLPLIVRPVGGHGGDGMVTVDGVADFENVMFPGNALEFYLIEFHDFQGDDGYYRKMRFVFVDGKPYPAHLLISNQWNIHTNVRLEFMKNNAWMTDEENSFLKDPDAYLGQGSCSALEEINRRIGLDFFGVDCALLPNGKLLLFEANAAMRVTMDDWHAEFPYKIRHTNKIKTAFEEMVLARIGR